MFYTKIFYLVNLKINWHEAVLEGGLFAMEYFVLKLQAFIMIQDAADETKIFLKNNLLVVDPELGAFTSSMLL